MSRLDRLDDLFRRIDALAAEHARPPEPVLPPCVSFADCLVRGTVCRACWTPPAGKTRGTNPGRPHPRAGQPPRRLVGRLPARSFTGGCPCLWHIARRVLRL